MKDILDIMLESMRFDELGGIEECLLEPQKYKSNGGHDLFGYPPEELFKAGVYYSYYVNRLKIDEANQILEQMEISITIQKLANLFKESFYRNIKNIDFLETKTNLVEIFSALCSKFYNIDEDLIKRQINDGRKIYEENWYRIVKEEDNVKPEELYKFYNSLKFPTGSLFPITAQHDMSLAYSILPLLLVDANKSKRVFDFGGNSGEILLTIASNCNVYECCLIEENEEALKFAEWRDNLFGVSKMKYIKEHEISEDIKQYEGKYDFGICTEVLEHVYYVEETIEKVSKLLKIGGILYFSASFGLYPEPSHLKKNIKYCGKEDELLAKFNLERIQVDLPIPLLDNIGIYIKK